jgi:hypothetical protein
MSELLVAPSARGCRVTVLGTTGTRFHLTYLAIGARAAFATGSVEGVLKGPALEVECEVSFPVLRAGIVSAELTGRENGGGPPDAPAVRAAAAQPADFPATAIGLVFDGGEDAAYPYPYPYPQP